MRVGFIAAGLLFLINNVFGFYNILVYPGLPFWQVLLHLHAGSIGWITLSAITFTVWAFSTGREGDAGLERWSKVIVWGTIGTFALYIPFFGLAFAYGQPFFAIMVVFGSAALAMIWIALIFAVLQLRKQQPHATTLHLLLIGALLVAGVGAIMGVLLDMEFTTGPFLPIAGADRVGVHAGMMDTYLFLAGAAIVEALVVKDPAPRWTKAGAVQAAAWTAGGLAVPTYFMTGIEPLLMVFMITLFIALGTFIARTGRRAIASNPFKGGVAGWMFAGTLWLISYTFIFLYAIFVVLPDIPAAPAWFFPLFAHVPYVGAMTNLILGLMSERSKAARETFRLGEPLAQWLINFGILGFVGIVAATGSAVGAAIMGTGVVLGVLTMAWRLARDTGAPAEPPAAGAD